MMKKTLFILVSFVLVLGISLGASAGESLFVLDEPIPDSINRGSYTLKGRIPYEMDVRIDGKDYTAAWHMFEKLITFDEVNQTKKLYIDVFDKSGQYLEQSFINAERSSQMRIKTWIDTKDIEINNVPIWHIATPVTIVDGSAMISYLNLRIIFEPGVSFTTTRSEMCDGKMTFEYGSNILKVNIDSSTATINGESIEMPTSPKIVHGTTFLPLRFMFEQFGCEVSYIADENAIFATKNVEPFVSLTGNMDFENIWIYEDIKPHKTLENTYILRGNKTAENRKSALNPSVEPIPREDLVIKVNNEEATEYKQITRNISLGEPSIPRIVKIEVLNKLGEIVETIKLELNR